MMSTAARQSGEVRFIRLELPLAPWQCSGPTTIRQAESASAARNEKWPMVREDPTPRLLLCDSPHDWNLMHWGGCQQGSPSGRALDGRAATRRRPLPNRARRAVPDYRNAVIESGSSAQPAASQRTSEYAKSDSCPRASTAATEIQNAPPGFSARSR